jgi:hypothetical protein
MNINVHIKQLILDGLPVTRAQGPLIQAAVESELARFLGVEGLSTNLRSGGAIQSVTGGTVHLTSERSPIRLGHQIARAVHGGISR